MNAKGIIITKQSVFETAHTHYKFISLIIIFLFLSLAPMSSGVKRGNEEFHLPAVIILKEEASVSRETLNFNASICTWYGNNSAAISLTFDDALASQADLAAPLMRDRGLRGTFYVPVYDVNTTSSNGICADWNDIINISNWGNEIGSHTLTHLDLITLSPQELWDEVVLAKQYLKENITGASVDTFSYPYGSYNEEVLDLVREHYIAARGDRHNISAAPSPSGSSPTKRFTLTPCNFGSTEMLADMNQLVEDAVNMKGWLVEMIHAIEADGWDPVPLITFTSHLDYIHSRLDDVWSAPFSNVTRYYRARDAAIPVISDITNHSFSVFLDSQLDPSIYNEPLTLNISVPSNWEDVRIIVGNNNYTMKTQPDAGERSFLLNLPLNVSAEIIKDNFPPILESVEMIPGFPVSYSPLNGSSSTEFTFQVNYRSPANRSPELSPVCIFDLNGDGDTIDTFGGEREGAREMYKLNLSDENYSDGSIYQLKSFFPPGSKPRFSYFARDSEGFEALDPDGIMKMNPGPAINNPPGIPMNLTKNSYHDLFPHFSWVPSVDPDGDMIIYYLKIENISAGSVWEGDTTSNNLTMVTPLEYNLAYTAKLYADDLKGGKSPETKLSFILRNYPPMAISNFSFRLPHPLMPEFSFTALPDPDSDQIKFYFDLFEGDGINSSKIISREEFNKSIYRMRTNLSDHSFYTLLLWVEDSHGAESPVYNYSFYLNRAPFPVKNLTVEDLKGYENGLNLSWTPSSEDDIAKYEIYRFDNSTVELEENGPIAILENDNHYKDLDVFDGLTYYYCVVAVDKDRAADHNNFTIASGKSVDDVPPEPLDGFLVKDLPNNSGSLEVSWNASKDGRFQGYHIYRALFPFNSTIGMKPVHTTISNMVSDTFWVDNNVSDNVTYYYVVAAFDRNGNELQTNLNWTEGISINDTDAGADNDEQNGDREKYEEPEKRSYSIKIAVAVGAICIIFVIIVLLVLKKKAKKEKPDGTTELESGASAVEDEVKNKIEYEKLYGTIGKSQNNKREKSSERLKELARYRNEREARERKESAELENMDNLQEQLIEFETDKSCSEKQADENMSDQQFNGSKTDEPKIKELSDDTWDWLDEPD